MVFTKADLLALELLEQGYNIFHNSGHQELSEQLYLHLMNNGYQEIIEDKIWGCFCSEQFFRDLIEQRPDFDICPVGITSQFHGFSEQFYQWLIEKRGPRSVSWYNIFRVSRSEAFIEWAISNDYLAPTSFRNFCWDSSLSLSFIVKLLERYGLNKDTCCLLNNTNLTEEAVKPFIDERINKLIKSDDISIGFYSNKNFSEEFYLSLGCGDCSWVMSLLSSYRDDFSEQFYQQVIFDCSHRPGKWFPQPKPHTEVYLHQLVNFSNWSQVCTSDVSEQFLERYLSDPTNGVLYCQTANWKYICRRSFSEQFFNKYSQYFNAEAWESISRNENLSEQFYQQHLDNLFWNQIAGNSSVSEDFLEKHYHRIANPWKIAFNCSLSEQFYRRHIEDVRWESLIFCKNITNEQLVIDGLASTGMSDLEKTELLFRFYTAHPAICKTRRYQESLEVLIDEFGYHQISETLKYLT